jgi:multiple sugar transport system ATP-binding protein
MGTKIVVMKDGIIQQVSAPVHLFNYPANKFVAGFIGTPQMNFFDVTLKKENDFINFTFSNGVTHKINFNDLREIKDEYAHYLNGEEHEVTLGIRAEHLKLSDSGVPFILSIYEVLGSNTHLFVHLDGEFKDYIVAVDDQNKWETNQTLFVTFEANKIHLFDKETEESILKEHE